MKNVIAKGKEKVSRIKGFIRAKKFLIATYLISVMADLSTTTAYAGSTGTGSTTAEGKWEAVIGFIIPWITRLGGVVILIGAIEFGLAFKNDDAEGKTKGMRTIIAGCIVTAVGLSSDIFLA